MKGVEVLRRWGAAGVRTEGVELCWICQSFGVGIGIGIGVEQIRW